MFPSVDHIVLDEQFASELIKLLPDIFIGGTVEQLLENELLQLQQVQNILYYLSVGRLLVNAQGIILDDIGQRFNIYRNGLDDDSYRSTIFLKTGEAFRSGTRPDTIEVLTSLFGEGSVATYKGNNFRFEVAVSSPCFGNTATVEDIIALLPLVTQARVVATVGKFFGFDGDNISEGFSSTADLTSVDGGTLGSLVYQPISDIGA